MKKNCKVKYLTKLNHKYNKYMKAMKNENCIKIILIQPAVMYKIM